MHRIFNVRNSAGRSLSIIATNEDEARQISRIVKHHVSRDPRIRDVTPDFTLCAGGPGLEAMLLTEVSGVGFMEGRVANTSKGAIGLPAVWKVRPVVVHAATSTST